MGHSYYSKLQQSRHSRSASQDSRWLPSEGEETKNYTLVRSSSGRHRLSQKSGDSSHERTTTTTPAGSVRPDYPNLTLKLTDFGRVCEFACKCRLTVGNYAHLLDRVLKDFYEQGYETDDSAAIWQRISQLKSAEGKDGELDGICKDCAYRWIEERIAEKPREHSRKPGSRKPEDGESALTAEASGSRKGPSR